MKKYISLVLVLIMLLTFTACEKLSVSNQIVSMTVKGQNSKKLTFVLTGEMAEYERTVDFLGIDDGDEKYFEIVEKSVNDKKVKYQVTGWQQGMSSFNIHFTKDGEYVLTIHGDINVLDKLKLECLNLSILQPEQYVETGVDGVDVPIRDGQSKLLYLESIGEIGNWIPKKYDETMVNIVFDRKTDENIEVFYVNPLKVGKTEVQFVHPEAKKQVVLNYTITEGTDSYEPYIISLDSAVESDYTFEDETKELNQDAIMNFINILDPEFYLPEGFVVEEPLLFSYKTGANYHIEDYENFDKSKIDGTYDAISVDATNGEISYQYIKTISTTLAAEINNLNKTGKVESVEDLTYGEKTVKFYTMTTGAHIALWEGNGRVSMIAFTSEEQSTDACRQVLDDIFL